MTLPSHSAQAIDEISKEIIEQLQEDGRRSYAAIGKAALCKSSQSPTHWSWGSPARQ